MATRMQQRRGTAATWTAANPILAAGEIGFEIDTNKFKIGDGSNRWANLTYFTADAAAAIQDLIDGAPGMLDTLNELAAAINDDPNFFSTVATNLSNHESDTTNVHGIADTSLLETKSGAQTKANAAQAAAEATASADATTKANNAVATANSYTDSEILDALTTAQGYADTAESDAKAYADSLAPNYDPAGSAAQALADANDYTDTAVANLVDSAPALLDTLNELAAAINDNPNYATDVANLVATKADTTYVDQEISDALTTAQGYADTAESDAKAYADSLAPNYDPAGSASTAQTNAEDYADGVALTAENNAKSYADGLASTINGTISALDTDDVAEGTNKYFTSTRAKVAAADLITNATKTNIIITGDENGLTITAENGVADSTTDNLAEGTTNLYHTTGRARAAISGGTGLDYNSTSGVMDIDSTVTTNSGTQTLTNKTISSADNTITVQVSNVSDITVSAQEINNLDGISSNVQDQIDLKANLAGASFTGNIDSTGTISSTNATEAVSTSTGAIVATGGLGVGGNAYIGGNIVVSGNLEINGTTTTVSTQDLVVSDPIIYVADNNTANLVDLGIVASFDDGAYQHTGLVRDASAGTWKLFKGVTDEPTTTVNFGQGTLDDLAVGGLTANTLAVGNVSNTEISYLDGVTSSIQTQLDSKVAKSGSTMTGALTLSGAPTSDLHAATKLYVDTVATDKADAAELAAQNFTISEINALDTDDIEEGSTNLYFTNARAQSAVAGNITSAINALDTDDIEEGVTNLYHTTSRVRNALTAGTGLDYNSTTGEFSANSSLVTLTGTQTLTNKTLTSPAFAGTPTAPTAALGTNTTQVATTAFVDAAIEALASRNLILDGGGV